MSAIVVLYADSKTILPFRTDFKNLILHSRHQGQTFLISFSFNGGRLSYFTRIFLNSEGDGERIQPMLKLKQTNSCLKLWINNEKDALIFQTYLQKSFKQIDPYLFLKYCFSLEIFKNWLWTWDSSRWEKKGMHWIVSHFSLHII